MKKQLLFSMCLTVGLVASAQVPTHPQYVDLKKPGDDFAQYYRNWQPGQPLVADLADDEEFYISRVKYKERFVNKNTQVDPNLNSDRKFFWWVPIGEQRWNALPSYFFNSEVFNMWSYLDHWGNWTSGILRTPAAYVDICHKNGVVTSVVGSVPFGASINGNSKPHGTNMKALVDGGAEKYLKYLRYYGVDGIGFNSEFNFSDMTLGKGLQDLAADANAQNTYGIPLAFAWYSITSNNGTTGGAGWDSLNNGNDNWFYNTEKDQKVSNYFFCNYNWNNTQLAESTNTAAKYEKASSYDVYAGMDMQGRNYANWTALQQYPISVGIWGAHNMNMLFESRGENGSTGLVPQETYLTRSELFFTGGSQNPVNTPAVTNDLLYGTGAGKRFHGISSFITARSVLWTEDLAKEPFVTYFNLGNGLAFYNKGEVTFNKEWYNIGIQDYMPTWRWWFTSKFMGREEADVPETGMNATFTWDDAWFGGSCMKITGSTDLEYLQLFKTKYPLENGDQLTIRYKVLNGEGDLAWACSAEGAETQEVSAKIGSTSQVEKGEWVEKTVKIGGSLGNLNMGGKTMALMGLKFTNAKNLNILVGEISLTRSEAVTPKAPVVKKSSVLGYNYQGADMKIIFSMGEAPTENPELTVYNSDVDTWMFKIYTQEEGKEPVLCTATTSWAAYVVGAPVEDAANKVRIGVSAVSVDGKTESEISWGEYGELPEPTISEGLSIDKPVIKADEEFTVRYTDPNHLAAKKWEIRNSKLGDTSEVILSSEGGTSMTGTLKEVGQYDLALTYEKNGTDTTEIFRGLVQISGPEVGAVPQIKSVKLNDGEEEVNVKEGEIVTYSYESRNADGTVSRALTLPDLAFGLPVDQLDFNDQTKYSIACWFKPNQIIHGVEGVVLLNIRDPKDSWPANNWGYVWQDITTKNTIQTNVRAADNVNHANFQDPTFVIEPGRWYHMCLVLDYDSNSGRTIRFYLNGRCLGEQKSTNLYAWRRTNYMMFGGYAANRSAFNGAIDEFQLYNKALTEEEALNTMKHMDEIPEGLIGYWDFESDPNEDGYLMSTGTNKELKASMLKSAADGDGEGQTALDVAPSSFDAGAPFLAGRFEVKTTPNWGLNKYTETSDETVEAEAGSVNVKYLKADDYQAVLTLSNSWGKDTKEFPYVRVSVSVDDADAEDAMAVYPNPFENELYINFVDASAYMLQVYDLAGNLVSEQAISAVAGDVVCVSVNAAPGTYLVKILNSDAETVKTVKLIKK